MNEHLEPDPLDALRAADPVDADRLSSASLARIRARVSEEVMDQPSVRKRSRPPRALALVGSGLAAAAIAFAVLAGQGGGATPATPGSSAVTGSAACVELYSLETLANRAFAFDGSVAAIEGDSVTFTINETYRGPGEATITLEAPGMTGAAITSAGGPNLVVGGRYLVAGEDRFAWGCGFTQAYDADVAGEWARTLAP